MKIIAAKSWGLHKDVDDGSIHYNNELSLVCDPTGIWVGVNWEVYKKPLLGTLNDNQTAPSLYRRLWANGKGGEVTFDMLLSVIPMLTLRFTRVITHLPF